MPWLAAFFFRAFFLRDFFAMVSSVGPRVLRPCGEPPRGWIPSPGSRTGLRARTRGALAVEGITMADEIRAEMVANVWKVVKAAGDDVVEGDTLVILESMKMEIPVVAESDGTIAQMAVNEGDVVQEGDLIAIVE